MKYSFYIVFFMFINLLPCTGQDNYDKYKARVTFFKSIIGKGKNKAETSTLNKAVLLKDSIASFGYKDLEADMYLVIGRLNQQLGQMGKTELSYKQALHIGAKAKDSMWVASMWDRLGDFYSLEERNYKALQCQHKALVMRETFDSTKITIPDSYTSLAKTYMQINELDVATSYLEKAIKLKKEINDTLRLGIISYLYGEVYKKQGKYAEAEKSYLKDLPKRIRQSNFEGLVFSYLGLAENYEAWGKFEQAEKHYFLALAAADSIKRYRNIGLINIKLGALYNANGYKDKAKDAFLKATTIGTSIDSKKYELLAYQSLYKMYKDEGKLDKALSYLELYKAVQDSFQHEEVKIKVEDYQIALELKEKEKEISVLDIENKKGKKQRNLLVLGIASLLVLLFTIVLMYRLRNKTLKKLSIEQQHTNQLLAEKEGLLNELEQKNIHLIHSEKMASIGIMTAGIAHELNNPVSSINASVEALKFDYNDLKDVFEKLINLKMNDGDESKFIELQNSLAKVDIIYVLAEINNLMKTIDRGTLRTSEIIKGLKTFSRDTGDEFMLYDVEEGIDTALTLLKHKLNNGITVVKNYQFNRQLICQISKINQVFLNILDNAIQSINDNGEIKITTEEKDNKCVITISDTGKGMSEITKNKIFEPFFTTKDVGEGTGLGLYISYAIIKQHNGEIKVESELGKGTSFKIYIPVNNS